MAQENDQQIFCEFKDCPEPTIIESLCVNCKQNGETRLMLTKLPFFKETTIASFYCEHCGNRNNQIQFAGELAPTGVSIRFKLTKPEDLQREVIKSQFATIHFPELELEIPESAVAEINTVEGILLRVEQELEINQSHRKQTEGLSYQKIGEFMSRLKACRLGKSLPFHMKIVDPSGNSNVKNIYAPKLDENIFISYPPRTLQELDRMGYSHQTASQQTTQEGDFHKINLKEQLSVEEGFAKSEYSLMEIDCHVCMLPGQMRMCQVSVPYFSDLIIMSFTCEHCGAHSTETKNSAQTPQFATTITLHAKNETDLKRELFKSETCKVSIPQLDLSLDYGTLGGVFTNVEGLLEKVISHLGEINSYVDSDKQFTDRMSKLLKEVRRMINGETPFTIVFRDPLSHSFLQNPFTPEPDQQVDRLEDARTEEELEHLGFNDMKV